MLTCIISECMHFPTASYKIQCLLCSICNVNAKVSSSINIYFGVVKTLVPRSLQYHLLHVNHVGVSNKINVDQRLTVLNVEFIAIDRTSG